MKQRSSKGTRMNRREALLLSATAGMGLALTQQGYALSLIRAAEERRGLMRAHGEKLAMHIPALSG